MSYKNILVPYDNSEHAKNALKEAIGLSEGVEGVAIHVVEVAAPPQDLVYSSINQTGFGMGVSLASQEDFAHVVEERNENFKMKSFPLLKALRANLPQRLFSVFTP